MVEVINENVPTADWDDHQGQVGGHFLQSRAWARFQEALGRQVLWCRTEDWSWLGVLQPGRVGSYLYSPYGPTVRQGFERAAESLAKAGKQHGAWFVRLEPDSRIAADQLKAAGGIHVGQMQPQRTMVVDLRQEESILRSKLSSGHRNAINAAGRRGLSFGTSIDPTDIDQFLAMLPAASARSGIMPHPGNYYRTMTKTLMPLGACRLWTVTHEDSPIASAISFEYQGTRYYAHAASYPDKARELQAAAPLVWHMLMAAKADGFHRFDLNGIAPTDDPSHPWAGFTRFKTAFGGEVVNRAGTWEIPLRPFRHKLYRVAKQVTK